MSNTPQMSTRIQDLRDNLVSRMPIQKAADEAKLSDEYITTVLIQYMTWQARLIRPRPRTVVVWPEVYSSAYYPAHQADIARLKRELEMGDDVNAALSNQVRSNVYAGDLPQKTSTMSEQEWVKKLWRGKDRIRVLVGAHHLHLGARQADGTVARTGPLLFVGVTHDDVFFLTIGDHDSFDDGSVTKLMWDKFEAKIATDGGGIHLPLSGGVTMGGTKVVDTFAAINIVKKLEHIDKQLDEQGAVDVKIRFDWEDIVLIDGQGAEIQRIKGRL